ncbi:MAG: HDIG domain-containing metalloprotein [bacterium]
MSVLPTNVQASKPYNRRNLILFCTILSCGLALTFIYKFLPSPFHLAEGDIAPITIRSPRDMTYESTLEYDKLVEQTKENFPASVQTNWSVGPHQKELLADYLASITKVKNDPSFTPTEKNNLVLQLLKNIPATREGDQPLPDDETIAGYIINLNIRPWEYVRSEDLRLSDYFHYQGITEQNISQQRDSIPRVIQESFTDDERIVIERLINPFLAINVFEDYAKTKERLDKAISSLTKPKKTIASGETIVKKGEKLTPTTIEALEKLGLINPTLDWQRIFALLLIAILIGILTYFYITYFYPNLTENKYALWTIVTLIIVNCLLLRNVVPERPYIYYLLPISIIPALFGIFIDRNFAFWTIGIFAVTLGIINTDVNDFIIFLLFSSFVATILISRARHFYHFIKAAALIAITNALVLISIHLSSYSLDFDSGFKIVWASIGHGFLLSVLIILALLYLGNIFNHVSYIQLLELANPNHPLLIKLASQAPGTYHHSLTVAELSQAAADALSLDPLLAKVYALYHDVGKLKSPEIFIENHTQTTKDSLKNLSPEAAAKKITSHVVAGVQIAKNYNVPDKIIRSILTHHGTSKADYFYQRALELKHNQKINEKVFTYPGPLPQNKEEALVMLADGSEAVVRSMKRKDPEDISKSIDWIIKKRMDSGQLAESNLTIGELAKIKDAFYATLMGIYHPRVAYKRATTNGRKKAVEDHDLREHPA